ncbi:MAG: hypothetical protein OXC31_15605 [Spirochaetaceae bacterium]|nr:hypothetical protein [Spirochaetaceae bacterium]
MNPYMRQIAAPDFEGDRLTDALKLEIVNRIYNGETLLSICKDKLLDRAVVDLELRFDKDFADAMQQAQLGFGDTCAERAQAVVLSAGREFYPERQQNGKPHPLAGQPIPLEERIFRLRHAKLVADNEWRLADRTSRTYRPKQAEKPVARPPTTMEMGMPEKDAALPQGDDETEGL